MFLPIGDEPNPKATPVATYGLIAANLWVWAMVCWPKTAQGVNPLDPEVLGYLAALRRATDVPSSILLQDTSAYDIFTWTYGFRPNAPSFISLLTSLFLHGGWLHVLGNMLFLKIFGDNIEDRIGWQKYLGLYLVSGVVATLFYALFCPTSPMPLIGASGAVSGILGAYFIWYGHNRVRVLMLLFIFIQVIYVPARFVLGFYLVIENVLPFVLQTSPTSSTAYGAHIGGFFAGSGFALAYSQHEATGSWGNIQQWLGRLMGVLRQPAPKAPGQGAAPAATAQDVTRLAGEGNFEGACLAYRGLGELERQTLPPGMCFMLADVLTDQGNFGQGGQILKRFLADHPNGSPTDLARGHLRLGLLQLRGLKMPIAAREHLLAVLDLLPQSDEAEAATEALRTMD